MLHVPFPEDNEDPEYQRLKEMKEEKTKEKVNSGDFNFEGAILYSFDLPVKTEGDINFNDVRIKEDAKFESANIGGNVWFESANIGRNVWFESAKTGSDVWFRGIKIAGDALFNNVKIGGNVVFGGANIIGNTIFGGAEIIGYAWFESVNVGGETWFAKANIRGYILFRMANLGKNVNFIHAKIDGDALFAGSEIGENALFNSASFSGKVELIPIYVKGIVDFRDAKFSSHKAQENACRLAKNQCIKFGDNHEADKYFYREMEGKRKQKLEIFRWPEYILVQLIFGYGVRPLRTFCIWFGFILTFAIIYFSYQTLDPGSEFIEYFYLSTTTAMTPGFGGYKISPAWQGLALVEAFFGTFMWAAFITIFARKYMR